MAALDTIKGVFDGGGPRVPVVLADSAVECGAACLVMVLAHYGRTTSLTEAHERCQVGRDGATALDVTNAARGYGLRVNPMSLDLDALEDVPCPAILHWGFNHFVVLERFGAHAARIADPGIGRREIDAQELSDQFTGVVLTAAPGEGFDTHVDDEHEPAWRMLGRRALRAPGARGLLARILLTSIGMQLIGLMVPLLTKTVVDSVLPLQIDAVIPVLGIGIFLIFLTQLALSFLRGLVIVNLQAKLDTELTTGLFEHLLALPYGYFQERSTGDLLQRLSSTAQIRNVLSNQVVVALIDGSFVVFYGVVLFLAAPIFGLFVSLLGALQVILLVLTTRRMTTLVTQELAAQGESQGVMVESISGIGALKAAGAEGRTLSHWTNTFTSQIEASMRRGRLSVMITSLTTSLQRFSPLLLLWLGAILVLDGGASLGGMLALISLSQLFLAPLGTLVAAGMQLQQVGGHLERIAQVLRVHPEESLSDRRPAPRLAGHIQFEGVSFRYDASAPWAVRDFSVEIQPGQKVAIVGRTGSGKSTVAKLLLGLYEPTRGRVLFDGTAMDDLDLRTVRIQCGVVMQEPTVFNTSVARNIAYNDPSLPMSAIVQAARLADLHGDIERMPMGYETIVAEGGSALSGGQRQRLAIARALVREPRILVLDEATSDLDSTTEATVSEHLAAQGASTLVIAHRLSTVQGADLILVMDKGDVLERGTHDELLEAGGSYAELIADQLVKGQDRAVHPER